MEAARRGACLILAVAALAGCGGSDDKQAAACAVDKGVLPEWARTGFSDPEPKMPHVLGRDHRIVAVLFGDPLVAPPARDRANKILWVSRDPVQPLSDLRIRASDGSRTVSRVVQGGPGPSLIDLPAGCWHLSLSWSGRSDSLDLRYASS
jgi:hypothetical protein